MSDQYNSLEDFYKAEDERNTRMDDWVNQNGKHHGDGPDDENDSSKDSDSRADSKTDRS